MRVLLLGVLLSILIYLAIAIVSTIFLYCSKDLWTEDFKKEMKAISFRLFFFFYSPISISKNLLGEVKW